jgi:hypothetical protein
MQLTINGYGDVLFEWIPYSQFTDIKDFANCAHNEFLALDMIRPEINEPEAPKCYIDLMKMCWNSNPENRPNAIDIITKLVLLFRSYVEDVETKDNEIKVIKYQFKEAEKFKISSFEANRRSVITHPQAVYTSRLLIHLPRI